MNTEFLKKHWVAIVGGVIGLIVLYRLLSGSSVAGSSTTSDISGGGTAAENLSAAASLQNSQINGQVQVAQLSADTATNQAAAALQLGLAQTAAQVSIANTQTAAEKAVALATTGAQLTATENTNATKVQLQKLTSQATVDQTAAEANTLIALGGDASKVQLAAINAQQTETVNAQNIVANQVMTLITAKKGNFNQNSRDIAPIVALETGQGSAGASIAQSNAGLAASTSTGSTIAKIGSGIGSILGGLFG